MKLALVGSRDYRDYEEFEESVLEYLRENNRGKLPKCIVSGGARGADNLAQRFALKHDVEMRVFPAEWDKHGKGAGPKRNTLIAIECTHMFAFVAEGSRGTWNVISTARGLGRRVTFKKVDTNFQ